MGRRITALFLVSMIIILFILVFIFSRPQSRSAIVINYNELKQFEEVLKSKHASVEKISNPARSNMLELKINIKEDVDIGSIKEIFKTASDLIVEYSNKTEYKALVVTIYNNKIYYEFSTRKRDSSKPINWYVRDAENAQVIPISDKFPEW